MTSFLRSNKNDIVYYYPERFEKYKNLICFFTTRLQGVSSSPYNSFNLGKDVGDDEDLVFKNTEKLIESFNLKDKKIISCKQSHSSQVTVVTKYINSVENSDALVSNLSGFVLVLFYADCCPIFIFDPKNCVYAIIHSGWRGTLKNITKKTISVMKSEFGTEPYDIIVDIGPCIKRCCYEIGSDVEIEFKKKFIMWDEFLIISEYKSHLDLALANKQQLLLSEVPEGNIDLSNICTSCNASEFFSYRRDKGITGRMMGAIGLAVD